MNISNKFEEILKKDQALEGIVKGIIPPFESILKDDLFFFTEYTDHGTDHIEKVLKAAEFLIPEESFQYIKPKEVEIFILAVILHDIGMHVQYSTFKAMIEGQYDAVRVDILDKKTWKTLWEDYLSEVRHWSSKQIEDVFGKPDIIIREPDLSDIDNLDGRDKKLIGECIRRHHARFAHEIALKGFVGNDDVIIPFGDSNLDERDKQLIGIVARSHGMNIRDTFDDLKKLAQDAWQYPDGLNVVFLMVLLRMADYLQIDKDRTDLTLLKIKTFNSPVSIREHTAHLSIRHIHFGNIKEPELIYVECTKPVDARMYVKIQTLIKDIQNELDLSWAVLGEIYGFQPADKPKIRFRRIDSNLGHSDFLKELDYVPQKISFQVNNKLSKLLVAPLYGDNPIFGVRELVQNATDACKERTKIEKDKGNTDYESQALVTVSIDKINDNQYSFKITDNGKGMTLNEILHYFLSVGSSFRQSLDWKKEFTSKDGKSLVSRNGRFGIGILATFLLGDEIIVKTKSYKADSPAYQFATNLDAEYIDLIKIDGFEIGTEIEIHISNNTCEDLTWIGRSIIPWTDWYIHDIPNVQYFLNGQEQSRKIIFNPPIIREFVPKDYGKIQWAYQQKQVDFPTNFGVIIACNGILVTRASQKQPLQNDIIEWKPSLIIEDPQGLLPLRLDRNDLDTENLPFEKELIEDISKDVIAKLLMLPIFSNEIKNYIITPYHIDLLYSAKGFTFTCNYFIDKLRSKFNLLQIITEAEKIQNSSLIFKQCDNYVIYPKFNQNIKILDLDIEGCILLPISIYSSKNEYWLKISGLKHKEIEIEWKNKEYIVYNTGYKRKNNIFDEENIFIVNDLGKNIQAIIELPMKYLMTKSRKGDKIVNRLFKRYFGDDIIIPYDMEDRKKLYPLAFKELKNYMKDYE